MLSADGTQPVGKISKQWSGLVKEYFTDADNFGIQCERDRTSWMLLKCSICSSNGSWCEDEGGHDRGLLPYCKYSAITAAHCIARMVCFLCRILCSLSNKTIITDRYSVLWNRTSVCLYANTKPCCMPFLLFIEHFYNSFLIAVCFHYFKWFSISSENVQCCTVHTCTHVCMHARIHTPYIYMHTHAHTHTHTNMVVSTTQKNFNLTSWCAFIMNN